MVLKVAYNDDSSKFVEELIENIKGYPLIKLETYHEQLFKERKKAFAIKNEWGTRECPFAILIDNKEPIKAFYNEQNNCNLDTIINFLNQINIV